MNPDHEAKTCARKMVFRSPAKARRHAKLRGSNKTWPYECPWCGQWHLSKSRRNK